MIKRVKDPPIPKSKTTTFGRDAESIETRKQLSKGGGKAHFNPKKYELMMSVMLIEQPVPEKI